VVVVNPSPDVYGVDLQMLQTVTGLVAGAGAWVVLPEDGELVPRVRTCQTDVEFVSAPRETQAAADGADAVESGRLTAARSAANPAVGATGADREHRTLSAPLVAILFRPGWSAVAPVFAVLAVGESSEALVWSLRLLSQFGRRATADVS
jgi:hypothetical protein